MALAGAGVSAVGTIASGEANQASAAYQATVAQNNAVIANQNAVQAEQAGNAAAQNQSLKGAAALGKVKANQAASGIDVNTGSAVNVQVGEREANQFSTENVFHNDLLQAYGYRVNAENATAESQLDTAKSEEAVPAAALSATGGLLSSAASVGGKWSGPAGIPNIPGFNPIAGVSGQ